MREPSLTHAKEEKQAHYDPTKIAPPPDAVRSGPGDRQIAYPPQFPRTKINGTPEGLTSVHIGVRPRDPVEKEKQAARREGYGEANEELQDASSYFETERSEVGSMRSRHRQEASRYMTPIKSSYGQQNSSAQSQRAAPSMTLKEAAEQWDKQHPSVSALSLIDGTADQSGYARIGIGDAHALSDDGRSQDGIYTYDYSGSSSGVRSKASSSNLLSSMSSSKISQDPKTVVHVDGTEGPVRRHPRPPEHQNSYGVPFGKRLRTLIQMRKQAEEGGLVPFSQTDDVYSQESGEGGALTLARRPALHPSQRAINHAMEIKSHGIASRAKMVMGSSAKSPAEPSSNSETTLTGRQVPAHASNSQTPSKTQQGCEDSQGLAAAAHGGQDLGIELSPSTPGRAGRKIKRMPVPQHQDSTTVSPEQARERQEGGDSAVRKRKSESNVKRDAAGPNTETPIENRLSEPVSSPDSRRLQHGTPSTADNRVTLLKGLPVSFRPKPSVAGQPRAQQSGHGHAGTLMPPAHISGIAPPMPEGEEYDSETEAERQAAWEEYYRLTQTSGIDSIMTPAQRHTTGHHQYEVDRSGYGYLEE